MEKLAYLFGAYLGDGCAYIGKSNYQFSITSSDLDFCEICQNICSDIFLKKGKIKHIYKNGVLSYHQLIICSKKIVLFLIEKTDNKRKIPKEIYQTRETKKEFIRGMMDADGWVTKIVPSDGYLRYRVGFKNTAKWVEEFSMLIGSMDVKIGKINKVENIRKNKVNKDAYTFSINTKDYCKKIGFNSYRKSQLVQETLLFYRNDGNKT